MNSSIRPVLWSSLRHACALLLALCLGAAHADDPGSGSLSQAYWEDASGQADFAQARTQTYTPYDGLLNRGYTTSVIWVRLHVQPPADLVPGERIVLRIHPNYLDQITLYDPQASSEVPQQVGDRVDPALQAIASIDFAFVLAPSPTPGAMREVWLRLQTTSSAVLGIEVTNESRFHVRESQTQLMAYGVLALLGVLWAIALSHWLQDRELLTALFLLRTLVYGIGAMLLFGLGRSLLHVWVRPALLDQAFNYMVIGGALLSSMFEIRLLQEWGLKSWALRCAQLMWLIQSFALGCLWFGAAHLALLINAQTLVWGIVLFPYVSIFGLRETNSQVNGLRVGLSRKLLIGYYSSQYVLLMVGMLPLLGVAPASKLSWNIYPIYSLFSSMMMVGLLHYRALLVRQRLHAADLRMALLRQEADTERHQREAQSRWLSLLMHEIKNPLTVIEMAQHKSNAGYQAVVRQNVAAIRHVLDRNLLFEKLGDDQLTFHKQRLSLGDCLADVIDEANLDEQRFEFAHLVDGEQCVYTDPECMRLMLSNLLGNALKYSPTTDKIKVEILQDDGHRARLGIAVSNRVGLAGRPDGELVFQKYYRGAAVQSIPGTGLGLHLVRKLAEQLGGECRYVPDSEFVRFELWLPV